MPDMKNVIKGLNDIGGFIAGRIGIEQARKFLRTIDDVIELLKEQEDLGTELTNAVELIHKKNERIEKLLKEQEAVEPTIDEHGNKRCGSCGYKLQSIADPDLFCCKCGKQVKWE